MQRVMSTTLMAGLFSILFVFSLQAQPDTPCGNCIEYYLIGNSSSSNELVSDYTPVGKCIWIRGTLTIDEPTSWSGFSIRMGTGSQIIVEDEFEVVDCHFRSCDSLWKGIKVKDEEVLIFKQNVIADAELAIQLDQNGTLTCVGNDFVDNYVGISAGSPFEACPSSRRNIDLPVPVSGNRFYTQTSLAAPYVGQFYYPS